MSPKFKNIILIGIDTLRADHLGCYGYKRSTSPAIDELANKGVLFKNCFAQAPATAPSFMSIFTSRYPTYHGITANIGATGQGAGRYYTLDPKIPTLAEVLRINSYRTGAFTGGGNVHPRLGFGSGFDYYGVSSYGAAVNKFDPLDTTIPASGMPIDEIQGWLGQNCKENFFLFLHTYAVHNPWEVPAAYRNLFDPGVDEAFFRPALHEYQKIFNETAETKKKNGWNRSWADLYHFLHTRVSSGDPQSLFYLQAIYDGAIRYVDDFVAKILQILKDFKISDHTIIIFTSDHGEEFMEHGKLGHNQFYQELLYVPLIMNGPAQLKDRMMDSLVRSIDIYPTILDIIGIKNNHLIQGTSIYSVSGGREDITTVAEMENYGYALQRGKYKYIYHNNRPADARGDELYDLETDPKERQNIASMNRDVVQSMFAKFEEELHRGVLPHPRRDIKYLI
ncbi:MAG: sulfatase [Candidatus Sungbacteria bacterium]|nr:sulfatase [Candidatus Sungbacteria bacterium]